MNEPSESSETQANESPSTETSSGDKKSGVIFSVFLVIGMVIALVSGYKAYDWPGVFGGSAIIGLGYVLTRAAQIKASGRYVFVEFMLTTVVWAMFTGLVYLLGSAFS